MKFSCILMLSMSIAVRYGKKLSFFELTLIDMEVLFMNQEKSTNLSFGERLKQLRKSRGFTQEDISNIIGISKAAYSRYEQDKTISLYALESLADFYDMTVDALLDRKKMTTDDKVNMLLAGRTEINKNHIYNCIKMLIKEFNL